MALRQSVASSRSARSGASTAQGPDNGSFNAGDSQGVMPEWISQAAEQGIKPEQVLAVLGLGMMGKMFPPGGDLPWSWQGEEDAGQADLAALRQRLELIQLALQTGAPLSTAEMSQLLGAKPGSAVIERGGLVARRISRNVWKLSRASETAERPAPGFNDGFRRRL